MSRSGEKNVLEGLKVLDFSWIFTGPIAARFLSDHGATVVKVESPSRLDDARAYSPFFENKPGLNRSYLFANYNFGKLSLSLNLSQAEGIELAKKLAVWADVLLDTYRPGVLARLGLGYQELRKHNEGLIMVSATMQGQTGPFALQPTFGAFFQATLGFDDILGWPDRPPCLPPSAYSDYITPCFILVAIMAALDHKTRTGEGQYIDISQLEASAHFLTTAFLDLQANGRVMSRQGNRSSQAAPHGVYRCRGDDRYCAISISTDEEWQAFCKTIGEPAWTRDPKLGILQGRKEKEDELDRLIEEWTTSRPAEEVMALLQSVGIAAGVVQNGKDLCEDPQLSHRRHFQVLNHPEMGSFPCEMPSFRLSETPTQIQDRFPILGQDNHYVCTQILQMSDEEFIALNSLGVFG